MTYAMFSDDALNKFRTFCDAAGFTKPPSPQGAFDQALKPRKESKMTYRYVPVANAGTSGALYMRSRSSNLAYDDVSHVTDFAQEILKFLRDKIGEEDMAQVEEMLKMEAGVKPDSQVDAEQMIAGAKARGAQDSAARIGEAGFNSRFPSARRIGRDDGYGFR
jgi:hypothetical protein